MHLFLLVHLLLPAGGEIRGLTVLRFSQAHGFAEPAENNKRVVKELLFRLTGCPSGRFVRGGIKWKRPDCQRLRRLIDDEFQSADMTAIYERARR